MAQPKHLSMGIFVSSNGDGTIGIRLIGEAHGILDGIVGIHLIGDGIIGTEQVGDGIATMV